MKPSFKSAVAAFALLAGLGAPAHAADGWYGQAAIGYTFDGEVETSPGDDEYDWGDVDLDEGWMGAGAIGYGFANGFRAEGEIAYRANDLEATAEADPLLGADLGGEADVWSAMLNLYYDFNRSGRWQPYVGVGVGAAQVNVELADADPPPTYTLDDDDTVAAYQVLIGVGVAINERLTLDLGYRYFAAPELEVTADLDGEPQANDADYQAHTATLGLRWQFAAPPPPPPPPAPPPPPPPPPAPPACPAADFTVYFEWDRSNLNQAALETIDAAVARARACNLGSVTVTGHTDTSGSADYNMGLAGRRASVVADALVARGIPAGAITTDARGETDLARATADGVREPLNRRTAVTISFR